MKLKKLISIPEISQLYSYLDNDFECEIYTAALRNYCSMGNPIRFNNFAFVVRELITKMINRLAPIELVKQSIWYTKESDEYEVTRKQQLQFCAQGYFPDSILPLTAKTSIETFIKDFTKLYRKLNQFTHISEKYKGLSPHDSFTFLKNLVMNFTSILEQLDEIKAEITQSVEDSVNNTITDKLLFESHEALIELSSETIVNYICIEEYQLKEVLPKLIIFKGEGYVDCELNYGSRNDSASFHHDVSIYFTVAAQIDDLSTLFFHEKGLELDNSSFFE